MNPHTNEKIVESVEPRPDKYSKHFVDKDTKVELDVREDSTMAFVDWLADNYKSFGTTLEFVTDRSQEGAQFVRGFGGIGGLLRYELNFDLFEEPDEEDWDEEDFF